MKNSKKKPVTDSQIFASMDRVGDKEYELRAKAKAPFEVVTKDRDTMDLCGNARLRYTKKGKAEIGIDWDARSYNATISSGDQLSSHLAMYRIVTIFECGLDPAEQQDFYKMNWSITLKHKASGQILMFGEWKGHFQIFTEGRSIKDLDKGFIKDAETLCTVLAMVKLPIGYDGTIAGSEA